MKNNKGFTLVELLAAIIILGILSVLALPVITNMVDTSRNKMYVNDAKKLISQVEYEMKVSNSKIEKPDVGNCIVVTMSYLETSIFDSAPNGGEYVEDNSYVVVKNVDGKYEYSAMLVEKVKRGGYRGVELTLYKNLVGGNATSHVVTFERDKLPNAKVDITPTYINQSIPNYLEEDAEVTAVYYERELDDASIHNISSSAPNIDLLEVRSTGGQGIGTLNAVLTLKVSDADTPRNRLLVYFSVDSGYQETNSIGYGENAIFTMPIDFTKYGYGDDGGEAKIYVVVADPDGNKDRGEYPYNLHHNEAPIFGSGTGITKRSEDAYNMLTAKVNIALEDDLDSLSALKICVAESDTNASPQDCTNYQNYNDVVNNNSFLYTFRNCANGCRRDGTTHYLTIFAKDTKDLVGKSKPLPYTFSANAVPIINEVVIHSKPEPFIAEESGGRHLVINVRADDDVDAGDEMKVIIEEENGKNRKTYSYHTDSNQNEFEYSIDSLYDGDIHKIYIYIEDSEGGRSLVHTSDYKLYKNEKPTITSFSLRSDGAACKVGSLCPESEGGKLDAILDIGLRDDIDYENSYGNVRVCYSTNRSDCDNLENFRLFSSFGEKIIYHFDGSYDGSNRKMYLVIRDSYGAIDEAEADYKLYKDSAPVIQEFNITSIDLPFTNTGALNANVIALAADDFDDEEDLLFTLYKDNNAVEGFTNIPLGNLYEIHEYVDDEGETHRELRYNMVYQVADSYDGSTHKFRIRVEDTKGNVAESTDDVDYTLYKNVGPKKKSGIDPKVVAAYNPYGINLADIYFYPQVEDDMEDMLSYKYCYKIGTSSTEHCMKDDNGQDKWIMSNGMYHLTTENLFKDITSYTGQKLKIYATAKDSYGLSVKTSEVTYQLFNDAAPVIEVATAMYDSANYDEEEATHQVEVFFRIKDIFDTYKVCVNKGTSCSNYGEAYDGTDGEGHSVTYDYSGKITESTSKVTLYVKGTKNGSTVVKQALVIVSNTQCSSPDLSHPKYHYIAKTGEISMTKCDSLCHGYNPVTNQPSKTTAVYTTTITYFNRGNPGQLCYDCTTQKDENMDCSFKDCFYANGNYNRKAIGFLLVDDEQPWTVTFGDVEYVNNNHLIEYESSYNNGDRDITLTKTNNKICSDCLGRGLYTYPFVRVVDR